jgi:hypothetical protein
MSIPESFASGVSRDDGLPEGKHDDQVDSTAQFLDWFKKPFPGQGIFELYRRLAKEAEERRKPQPVQVTWAPGCLEWQAMNKSS